MMSVIHISVQLPLVYEDCIYRESSLYVKTERAHLVNFFFFFKGGKVHSSACRSGNQCNLSVYC